MKLQMASLGKGTGLTIDTLQGLPCQEGSGRPRLPWDSGFLVSMATPHLMLLPIKILLHLILLSSVSPLQESKPNPLS